MVVHPCGINTDIKHVREAKTSGAMQKAVLPANLRKLTYSPADCQRQIVNGPRSGQPRLLVGTGARAWFWLARMLSDRHGSQSGRELGLRAWPGHLAPAAHRGPLLSGGRGSVLSRCISRPPNQGPMAPTPPPTPARPAKPAHVHPPRIDRAHWQRLSGGLLRGLHDHISDGHPRSGPAEDHELDRALVCGH